MAIGRDAPRRWSSWTVEIKVWKILAALVALPILVLWYRIVHQNDEILALVRSEVMMGAGGERTWAGSFINTGDETLRDVAVTVDFLDERDAIVGKVEARAAELPFGTRLELQATLSPDALRLRIYSVQWRKNGTAALMGPFRDAWEFGYLMVDPAAIDR